jgi:hypothetical protein
VSFSSRCLAESGSEELEAESELWKKRRGLRLSLFKHESSIICLSYKLRWLPLEPFLAGYAAKVIGFAIMSDLELGCPITQDLAANGISRHCLSIDLKDEWAPCFL